MKHASTLCRVQMHEQIYTWVFCEVSVVRNFNFLLVRIVCSHIHSFRLPMRLHRGVFRHCAICIDYALAYAGHVFTLTAGVQYITVLLITTGNGSEFLK